MAIDAHLLCAESDSQHDVLIPTACDDQADARSQDLECDERGDDDELSSDDQGTTTAECSFQQQPPRFCLNCTSRLPMQQGDDEQPCSSCGHVADNDAALLDLAAVTYQQPPCMAQLALHAHTRSCKVALLYDERMELHEEESGDAPPHPERPDRIRAVMAKLLSSGTADLCQNLPCREATLPELQAVHAASLVRAIHYASCVAPLDGHEPSSFLSPDMYINDNTFSCARLAAGSAAEAAVRVVRGDAPHSAAIIRPPGHHAESGMAMGFCFFNNAAVAARAAQAAGARRVIIFDWDIHFGNGTQQIFEHDPSVLYLSIHRHDGGQFYPGTGAAIEVGLGEGQGYSVNIAWQGGGMGDNDYMAALRHIILPIARQFDPDLLIVSAGFDAAEGDPIGECCLTPAGFAHMTAALKEVAPLCLLLEGGYNLSATAVSTDACLRVLLGEQPPPLPRAARGPCLAAWEAICEAVQVQSPFWSCLRASIVHHRSVRKAGMLSACAVGDVAAAAAVSSFDATASVGLGQALCMGGSRFSVLCKGRGGLAAAQWRQSHWGRCTIVRIIKKRAVHAYWRRRQGAWKARIR